MVQVVEIKIMRIGDLIVKREGIPDLINIDSNGSDFQVLRNSRETFGTTELLLVEPILCCHSIANDIRAVINRMTEDDYYHLCAGFDINTQQWFALHSSPGLQWFLISPLFDKIDRFLLL